jgi:protein-glutamine gamma-glutamyltransferase
MLRMIGIPSRVGSGFSPGKRSGDTFVVRDYDAHSWVEVYFNGIGWMPFDPTPAAAPAQLQIAGPAPAPQPQRSQPAPAPPAPAPDAAAGRGAGSSGGGSPWWVAAVLAVLLAAAALPPALRRRRWRTLPAPLRVEGQLQELEAALGRLGHRVPAGTTLHELERRLGRGRPRSVAYAGRLRAARFEPGTPPPPSLSERRRLRRELSLGSGAWARLRGLLAFPPGAPGSPSG